MLNGKHISIDRIMEGVYRDYGWTHEVDWIDVLEWAGEVMDLIAAPKQYVQKITDGNDDLYHPCAITIKNYRGSLPCDLIEIQQVREFDNKIPMRYASGTFHKSLPTSEATLPEGSLTQLGKTFTSPFIAQNNMLKDNNPTQLNYTINNNHIFTNFEEGTVEMAYTAFPTDCNGHPLIPDNIKYVKAVKAFIAEKIGQRLYLQGKMTGDRFHHLQQEYAFYVGAADVAGRMPNVDEMESWKNQLVRLIPNMNAHNGSFTYSGDKPRQTNHNSI